MRTAGPSEGDRKKLNHAHDIIPSAALAFCCCRRARLISAGSTREAFARKFLDSKHLGCQTGPGGPRPGRTGPFSGFVASSSSKKGPVPIAPLQPEHTKHLQPPATGLGPHHPAGASMHQGRLWEQARGRGAVRCPLSAVRCPHRMCSMALPRSTKCSSTIGSAHACGPGGESGVSDGCARASQPGRDSGRRGADEAGGSHAWQRGAVWFR